MSSMPVTNHARRGLCTVILVCLPPDAQAQLQARQIKAPAIAGAIRNAIVSCSATLGRRSTIDNPCHHNQDRAQRSKEPRVLAIRFLERRVAPLATLEGQVVLDILKRRLTIG